MPEESVGPVTIMFTDLERSTNLATDRGDDVAQRIHQIQDQLVREQLTLHDGVCDHSTGDGLLAVFRSTRKALACAVDIQRRVERHNRHTEDAFSLRIGINTGEVSNKGGEVFGVAVNAAARITDKAKGGEILVSEIVKQLAGPLSHVSFAQRGRVSLKGFKERWRLFEVRWEPSEEARMIRVLVADDQAVVRGGLRMILEAQDDIEVIGEASDGQEALKLVNELDPDVVLMDIRMPGLDGIDATRRISSSSERPAILVLTTYGLDENIYGALKAGAAGFLVKTDSPDRLVHAVRVVAAGDALLGPESTRRLIERFISGPQPNAAAASILERLTEREVDVLKLVAQGLSNLEIARALFISEGTVKTHVARILSKLGCRDRVQAVVCAYESGVVQPGMT